MNFSNLQRTGSGIELRARPCSVGHCQGAKGSQLSSAVDPMRAESVRDSRAMILTGEKNTASVA